MIKSNSRFSICCRSLKRFRYAGVFDICVCSINVGVYRTFEKPYNANDTGAVNFTHEENTYLIYSMHMVGFTRIRKIPALANL